jgi:predicted phage terminase large subunit-like protein
MQMDRELLNAVLRQDLYAFVQRVFREIQGGETFEESWAVEAICYALQEVAFGRRRRQIIAVPPRSLKSICASIALPAWILGHDPSARIIAVSYAQTLAERFSAATRQVMKSAWYREAFPETVISPFKDSESYFRTTAGGFRDATSIGGTLTGKGGNMIIIDDPAKPDEIMSPVTREAVNSWYGRTLVSRLDNKLTGRILLVMQRLHLEDLVGHVQRAEDWNMLRLPAISERSETIALGERRTYRRRPGEVLRPQSEPLEVLDKVRAQMGSHAFSAQYLQRPIPSNGEIVKMEWFKHYAQAPEPPRSRIVQSWDTATKIGGNTDYSACVTAAICHDDVYILDIFSERLDFPSLHHAVIARARRFNAEHIIIEDKGAGTSLCQQLRSEKNYGVPDPSPFLPVDDKTTRMATASPMVERGEVFLPKSEPAWLRSFLDELLQFPEAAHDDQVDAFSQLLLWNYKRLHLSGSITRRSMFGPRPR